MSGNTLTAAAMLMLALQLTLVLLPSAAGEGGVRYKPAGEATLKYGDGVTVHRHADGSVEVSDSDSAAPPIKTVRKTVKRHQGKARTTVKTKRK